VRWRSPRRSGRTPGSEDLKLAKLLAGQAGQAFANIELVENVREGERLQRELEVAADIQSSILPEQEITWDWLEFRGLCTPAAWVGGDANLAITAADGGVLAGVADVSGHGVSSALLMNAFATQVNALAVTTDDPGHLLAVANDLVSERVGAMGMFVTAVLMHLVPGGRVRVANAGHPAPIVVTAAGETSLIGDPGLPLGVLGGEVFEVEEVEMPPGSVIVAFSDGVTEAMNPEGELFGVDRLLETLARHVPHVGDGSELIDRLLMELQTFERGQPRTDDLTIIVLRRMS
jgi:sigma-B regulation protein RsbU (phosphoserine phosphatase)